MKDENSVAERRQSVFKKEKPKLWFEIGVLILNGTWKGSGSTGLGFLCALHRLQAHCYNDSAKKQVFSFAFSNLGKNFSLNLIIGLSLNWDSGTTAL